MPVIGHNSPMHQATADVLARHLADRLRRDRLARSTPGIRLRHGVPAVGHLGGDALLPPGMAWPGLAEEDPLTLLLSLDLAALPRTALDLPTSGRLLFFRSEDDLDYGEVHWFTGEVVDVPSPPELRLDRVEVCASVEPTWPSFDHPDDRPLVHTSWDLGFPDTTRLPVHRIGGFGECVQAEPAFAPDMTPLVLTDHMGRSAQAPVMLAQIDTDHEAGIGWGDLGNSHWAIPREALARRRFEEVEMTWSCY